jgi:hypothetical protein
LGVSALRRIATASGWWPKTLDSGERVVLADATSWRSIEVLGSAAPYYGSHYDNPEPPREQVRARAQASELGGDIWDTAEATVGIELHESKLR